MIARYCAPHDINYAASLLVCQKSKVLNADRERISHTSDTCFFFKKFYNRTPDRSSKTRLAPDRQSYLMPPIRLKRNVYNVSNAHIFRLVLCTFRAAKKSIRLNTNGKQRQLIGKKNGIRLHMKNLESGLSRLIPSCSELSIRHNRSSNSLWFSPLIPLQFAFDSRSYYPTSDKLERMSASRGLQLNHLLSEQCVQRTQSFS